MHKKKNRESASKFNKAHSQSQKSVREEVTGKVSMTREGYAFIIRDGFSEDIFVSSRKLRGALHNDIVNVAVTVKKGGTKRQEGEVVAIVKRSETPYIGVLQIAGNNAWVITESRNMPYDIRIADAEDLKQYNGLKVAAIIQEWPRKSNEPIGRIIDILGKPGENDTEMHAILTEFGLPYKFEKSVEQEAEKISDQITQADIKSRRDFRAVTTFTIDPTDAKDFDDALSIRKLDSGNWEVGVHIADVTHYVKPGSIIDKEATDRATSVYLVDRTVPMLPEKLSNRLCSLRPNEEKLCFSAVFEITEKGKVVNRWFGKTVIESDYRFDYNEAQQVIDTKEGRLKDEVLKLHQLASLLREDRFKKGAISFERPEMKVEVDENGKPINVYSKVSKDSNWLIEEFMLLANREVAEFIAKRDAKKAKTFVYRIHEEPNLDKINTLRTFIKHFGFELKCSNEARDLSKGINKLLEKVRETPYNGAIEIMALRSMARARYSTDNVGHYGLAFDYYTHFTSPIRRYPDMMVHRLLEHYLDKGKSADKGLYEDLCKHSSEREQLASEAERASIKYKMVEYMQDKIGNIYEASVSGITEWGIFAELEETKIEGLISLREIKEDYLVFNEESYTLTGKRTGVVFFLGKKIKIKVEKSNLEQKQLDFSLIWEDEVPLKKDRAGRKRNIKR